MVLTCAASTELALWRRGYDGASCDLVIDRDVDAARNIRARGLRLMREQHREHVASIRGDDGVGFTAR